MGGPHASCSRADSCATGRACPEALGVQNYGCRMVVDTSPSIQLTLASYLRTYQQESAADAISKHYGVRGDLSEIRSTSGWRVTREEPCLICIPFSFVGVFFSTVAVDDVP
jgi:hypothetical protein